MLNAWKRWWVVVLFAVAMAWMEAATVVYLRSLIGRLEPFQARPLPSAPELGAIELWREAATLLMLATVGWLAGQTWRSRFGHFALAFGVWDILYYVFLRLMCHWPRTLLDWDILFLLPLPWWGPVLSPILIAGLMIGGGTLLARFDSLQNPLWPGRGPMVINGLGVILALYLFMADAIRNLAGGEEAIRNTLPSPFNWPLFSMAWLLMAVPVFDLSGKVWNRFHTSSR